MIAGIVTADREAIIRLTLHGPDGQRQQVEAVIDTGFDGWLSLPPVLIARLGLPWQRRGLALLADGSTAFSISTKAPWSGTGTGTSFPWMRQTSPRWSA